MANKGIRKVIADCLDQEKRRSHKTRITPEKRQAERLQTMAENKKRPSVEADTEEAGKTEEAGGEYGMEYILAPDKQKLAEAQEHGQYRYTEDQLEHKEDRTGD